MPPRRNVVPATAVLRSASLLLWGLMLPAFGYAIRVPLASSSLLSGGHPRNKPNPSLSYCLNLSESTSTDMDAAVRLSLASLRPCTFCGKGAEYLLAGQRNPRCQPRQKRSSTDVQQEHEAAATLPRTATCAPGKVDSVAPIAEVDLTKGRREATCVKTPASRLCRQLGLHKKTQPLQPTARTNKVRQLISQ